MVFGAVYTSVAAPLVYVSAALLFAVLSGDTRPDIDGLRFLGSVVVPIAMAIAFPSGLVAGAIGAWLSHVWRDAPNLKLRLAMVASALGAFVGAFVVPILFSLDSQSALVLGGLGIFVGALGAPLFHRLVQPRPAAYRTHRRTDD